jgi:hypothetical protein
MPSRRPVSAGIGLMVSVAAVLACNEHISKPDPSEVPVASLDFAPLLDTLEVGSSFTVLVTPRDAANNPLARAVRFTSKSPNIATIDSISGKVQALSVGAATLEATVENITKSGVVVVIPSQKIASITISPANPSVQVGSTVALNAAAKNATGDSLNATFAWASGGVPIATVNAATGVVTGVSPGVVTISATSGGISGTASLTVTPSPQTCGQAITIVSLSRDAGATAGGDTLTIAGTGLQDLTASCVKFGGEAVTALTIISPTAVRVTIPAHAAGSVNVLAGDAGKETALTSAFDYLPSPTNVYVTNGFEVGTLTPLAKDLGGTGTVVVDNSVARTGSNSAKCSVPSGTSGIAQLLSTYGGMKNPALNAPNGVYHRWYMMLSPSALDNTAVNPGQMKLTLSRVGGTQPPAGWLMFGIGGAFASNPKGEVVIVQDFGTVTIAHTQHTLVANQWTEFQTWYKRSGGIGTAKLWINGKLKFTGSSASFGSDGAADNYAMQVCIPFAQITGGVDMWVDDVAAADGYIKPPF